MTRLWDTFMFRNELDLLEFRLEELDQWVHRFVLVESPITHRGYPKPLYYAENEERYKRWHDKIVHVVTDLPDHHNPWVREHAQRRAMWGAIKDDLNDDDIVLIADLDEFPSPAALSWRGSPAASLDMKNYLYAVDWLVSAPVPPTSVITRAWYLRQQADLGYGLGEVRDRRSGYEVIADAGHHFSWLGGTEKIREKLKYATCHTEIWETEEAHLILDGTRYRTDENGGGLPVVPVDIDDTYPAFIREKRCPPEWYRPR